MNEALRFRIPISDGFYLGRIVRSDKTAYLEHLSDPEIARHTLAIPYPYTEADADWWLDQCEKQSCDPEKLFAIRESHGHLIGAIGIDGHSPADQGEAEFGYWLAKPYWGRGLMTRAVRAFTNHAFQRLQLRRLYATPFTDNIASQRVLEKAGFKRAEPFHMTHLKHGVQIDALVYEQFAGRQGSGR